METNIVQGNETRKRNRNENEWRRNVKKRERQALHALG